MVLKGHRKAVSYVNFLTKNELVSSYVVVLHSMQVVADALALVLALLQLYRQYSEALGCFRLSRLGGSLHTHLLWV